MNLQEEGVQSREEQLKDGDALVKEFRLRAERPRVTRLSRKVLASASAIALALVGGGVLWALQGKQGARPAHDELYGTDHHNIADNLAALPRDYAAVSREVPSLGPPLPGDLGRPILAAQGGPPPVTSPVGLDQEQQRRDQETEAARVSRLFAATSVRETTVASSQTANEHGGQSNVSMTGDDGFSQNGQERKLAFLNAPVDRRTTSPDRMSQPASPYVVQAGTVIPGALITGIRSDLPGLISAQVTENVYDTPTGQLLLIPQGARLIGSYDSQIAFGQSRILLVWTRLLMPNGRSIVLERQPGADTSGYSGLEDEIDNHWLELFKAAALSTLLGVGAELGSGADGSSNADILRALRSSASDSLNQTGQQVVRRNLNIQPTLTIRPGFPIRVLVNRDLVLERYRT